MFGAFKFFTYLCSVKQLRTITIKTIKEEKIMVITTIVTTFTIGTILTGAVKIAIAFKNR